MNNIVYINNIGLEVPIGSTVLQACEKAGMQIPVFCYNTKLSVAGNCRMCLVEIEKSIKPVASCAMPVADNMKIFTNTPLVKKARESVLEFLLLNHPLDCPICDQGGECDLQDQTLIYGSDRSRFYNFKSSVKDTNLGPLVKTIMTRCIYCTRCIRFGTEIAGVEIMGMSGRGSHSEIGTYIGKLLNSEISANIIDLCPVGALTSKPYAFTARSWELEVNESIDVTDGLGSNLNIYCRDNAILRILPRYNKQINEEWITDKARFSYDSLTIQRITFPLLKDDTGNFQLISWKEALNILLSKFKLLDSSEIKIILGNLNDLLTKVSGKTFANLCGIQNIVYDQNKKSEISLDLTRNYKFNTKVENIKDADFCLLVGINPRTESALINTRLIRGYTEGNFDIHTIGSSLNLPIPTVHLGSSLKTLQVILEGKHKICKNFKQAKKPLIIFGNSFISNTTMELSPIYQLLEQNLNLTGAGWNGFNFLHSEVDKVGSLDIGINSNKKDLLNFKLIYLIGADESECVVTDNGFVVYQGAFWDQNANKANLILPATVLFETDSYLINTEGRPQKSKKFLINKNLAMPDFKIIYAILEALNLKADVINFNTLLKVVPSLGNLNKIQKSLNISNKYKLFFLIGKNPINFSIRDFYRTNSMTRLSPIMAECSKVFKRFNFF